MRCGVGVGGFPVLSPSPERPRRLGTTCSSLVTNTSKWGGGTHNGGDDTTSTPPSLLVPPPSPPSTPPVRSCCHRHGPPGNGPTSAQPGPAWGRGETPGPPSVTPGVPPHPGTPLLLLLRPPQDPPIASLGPPPHQDTPPPPPSCHLQDILPRTTVSHGGVPILVTHGGGPSHGGPMVVSMWW